MPPMFFVRRAGERRVFVRAPFTRALVALGATACALMIAVALPDVARSAPAALSNAEVLGTYIQVNGFDVETALLARAQARSTAARDLAARVAEDHLGVRQAAYALAVTCKASPVLPNNRTAAAVEHGRAMHDLAALSGAEFDRAYLKHEVAFHRAAIDAVRKVLLPATTCAALRAHFTDVLPAMEHHLAETERLANELTAR